MSAIVDNGRVVPSYGDETDARIKDSVGKYADKASYTGPCWYLEAEGIDIVRSDGQPFRQRDVIKLKSSKGSNLGKKQAPDQMASAFRVFNLSAAVAKVGSAESAVGHIFDFATTDLKLGGGFTKPVRLFPRAIMPDGWTPNPEDIRTVTPRSDDEEAAPADGGIGAAPPEEDVLNILREVLNGKTPGQMMQAILDDQRLKAVGTVLGVPLMPSAVDESLAPTLVEHGIMQITDGVLRPVS